MPTYDYQCDQCHTVFEIRATFKEKDAGLKPSCPHCHAEKAHQLLAVGLAVLQGHDGASQPASGSCAGCGGGSCSSCAN